MNYWVLVFGGFFFHFRHTLLWPQNDDLPNLVYNTHMIEFVCVHISVTCHLTWPTCIQCLVLTCMHSVWICFNFLSLKCDYLQKWKWVHLGYEQIKPVCCAVTLSGCSCTKARTKAEGVCQTDEPGQGVCASVHPVGGADAPHPAEPRPRPAPRPERAAPRRRRRQRPRGAQPGNTGTQLPFQPVTHHWGNQYPVCGSSDRSFMVDPLSYFPFHSLPHNWCNCYPVCGSSDWSFMGWTHWAISRSTHCPTTGVTGIMSVGRRIDPSWWTHWAISRSTQCPTTGVTGIMSVGRRINPSWWTHWAISRSTQCPTTGVTGILSVGRRIDPSWWTHWAISRSNQWPTTGVTVILSVGRRIDPSWWTHWAISRSTKCPTTGVTGIMSGSSDRSFMVDPLSYFPFHPVPHDWGNWYHVCGSSDRSFMVDPLSYFPFHPVPHDWGNWYHVWVVGSILHGGPIELFPVPPSAPRLG